MLTTTKGPGDPETWPCDPAAVVDIEGDHIRRVIAGTAPTDPVGRDREILMDLLIEEPLIDDPDARDAALVYLTQHMGDDGFPPVVYAALDAAFESVAYQTDIRFELEQSRRRRAAELAEH